MQDSILDTLKELVSIPSINPAYPEGSPEEHLGEARVAGRVADFLKDVGAAPVLEEVRSRRPNVYCEIEGTGAPRLLLEAHIDTVGVEGMSVAPFEPKEKDGRLYGRGTCDDKASVAVMIHVMKALAKEPANCTVCFSGAVGEEHGADGAYHLMETGRTFDAAIVGEPTALRVANSHKGVMRCRVTSSGVAAHGSTPAQGVNAIYVMTPVLAALERKAIEYDLRAANDAVRHVRTLNVGVIRGGSGINLVPDRCELEFELRYLPDEDPEKVKKDIDRLIERAAMDPPKMTLGFLADRPSMVTAGNERIVELFVERVGRPRRISYHTDGGIYSKKGIPCVVFGPGNAAQAHTADEFVEIAQLEKAYETILDVVRAF